MKPNDFRRLTSAALTIFLLAGSGCASAKKELADRNAVSTPIVTIHTQASRALQDPLIEEGRQLAVVEDFKYLADLSQRVLNAEQRSEIETRAASIEKASGRKAAVKFRIDSLYEHKDELLPVSDSALNQKWTISSPEHKTTFDHIEKMWTVLTRRTPANTDSSLIPLPYPLLIPGARFQEGYYWDTFFAFPALLKTGRQNIVRGQIENFLFLLKIYKMIPNGTRDYYLSRSQPPLFSQMIRVYTENEIKTAGALTSGTRTWLARDVYPLVKSDYENFWMNSSTRYDSTTGLNHHWDALNIPRPERHAIDNEEALGKTYRDTRAEAESGKDFTNAFESEATHYAPLLLNSLLYQFEKDLAWMAELAGQTADVSQFRHAAEKRKAAMNRFMWDNKNGLFRDYNLRTKKRSPVVTADIFLPLYTELASRTQV